MNQEAKEAHIRAQAPLPAVRDEMSPLAILDRAVASGASVEVLERLMSLQERHEGNIARKAFNEAFSAFKAEAITIVRNKGITDGPLKGKSYADLSSFVQAVTPALSLHGLSASWEITRDDRDWIEVTCVIEHTLGHSKRITMGGPPDTGGAKNALQARVSTVSYLERCTLKAGTGLAESGDDDDGGSSVGDEPISEAQLTALRAAMDKVEADVPAFCKHFRIEALPALPGSKYEAAITMLERKAAQKGKVAA